MKRARSDGTFRVIGLTGGIGSGKSRVGRFLAQRYGIKLLDADQLCRELLLPGKPGWQAFVERFQGEFLTPGRDIDRPRLRQAIFHDEALRLEINALLHPLVRREMINRLQAADSSAFFLVEVPLLFEAGWQDDFDAVVVVYACQNQCLARIQHRDRIAVEAAQAAVVSQRPLWEKALMADHAIDNSGSWGDTLLQLLHLGELFWGRCSEK